jgi:hypothetical protein
MLAMGVLLSVSRYGRDKGNYFDRSEDERRVVHRRRG